MRQRAPLGAGDGSAWPRSETDRATIRSPVREASKIDAADAEAIVIAARHPEMRFVEPKTIGPDLTLFKTGRDFAAWLGLVPKQHSEGGKERLVRMTKAGQADIRSLLIIGAMSRLTWLGQRTIVAGSWLSRMLTRKPKMLIAVALGSGLITII